MPKVYLCSFATNDFKNAQELLTCSALLVGDVDNVFEYNPNNILCPKCKCDQWNKISHYLMSCDNCEIMILKVKCINCNFLNLLEPVRNGYFHCSKCEYVNYVSSYQKSNTSNNSCVMF